MNLNDLPESVNESRSSESVPWWGRFRDVVYIAIMLVGWGVLYGQLTTRLQSDEAAIAQMQSIINDRMATEKEITGVNGRLDDISRQLGNIQGQIFQIQQLREEK